MKKKGLLYILPGMAGVMLFYLLPFFKSLQYTFTEGVTEVRFVGFENFANLLKNPSFMLAAKNTFSFIAVSVPLLIFCAVYISIKLNGKMSAFNRFAVLSPMIMPAASAALGWSIIFGDTGVINGVLKIFGIKGVEFLGEKYALWVFILMFFIKNLGYMVIVFTSAVSSLPKEYREAFAMDSDSDLKFAVKIILPEIAPIVFFAVILSVANSFQMFREIYAVYGNSPPMSMYILQYFMNNNFFKLNYQRLSTAAFIVIFAVSVLVVSYLEYSSKRYDGRR